MKQEPKKTDTAKPRFQYKWSGMRKDLCASSTKFRKYHCWNQKIPCTKRIFSRCTVLKSQQQFRYISKIQQKFRFLLWTIEMTQTVLLHSTYLHNNIWIQEPKLWWLGKAWKRNETNKRSKTWTKLEKKQLFKDNGRGYINDGTNKDIMVDTNVAKIDLVIQSGQEIWD